jgi:hypothetical protein
MGRTEVAMGCALTAVSVAGGAALGVATAQNQLPALFWPVDIAIGVCGGIVFFACVAVLIRGWFMQRSPALDISFSSDDASCVHLFPAFLHEYWIGSHQIAVPSPSKVDDYGTDFSTLFPTEPATTVRLHVHNLRSRRLNCVQVRLIEVQTEDGHRTDRYSDWLKWMHDDVPNHPASTQGRQIEARGDPHSYVDLATKAHGRTPYFLDYAILHLREKSEAYGPLYVHLLVTGKDDETNKPVPPCERAFTIEVDDKGSLKVVSVPVRGPGLPPPPFEFQTTISQAPSSAEISSISPFAKAAPSPNRASRRKAPRQ